MNKFGVMWTKPCGRSFTESSRHKPQQVSDFPSPKCAWLLKSPASARAQGYGCYYDWHLG